MRPQIVHRAPIAGDSEQWAVVSSHRESRGAIRRGASWPPTGKAANLAIHIESVYPAKCRKEAGFMHRRLNITLPDETVRLIDRVAKKGNRSRLISDAVRRYVLELGRSKLRRRLKEGAKRRAARDRELAQDWLALEDQA